jgi:hypothetical protein
MDTFKGPPAAFDPKGLDPSLQTLAPHQSFRRPALLLRFLAAHRRLRFGARPQRLARRRCRRLELFPHRPRFPRRQAHHYRLPLALVRAPRLPRPPRPRPRPDPNGQPRAARLGPNPLRPPCPRAEIPQTLERATRTPAPERLTFCHREEHGDAPDLPETQQALGPRYAATAATL